MNSKLSILILIFGPLFLMGIMGAALQNTELRDVKASVFAHEEGSEEILENDWYVDSYADQLRQNAFQVKTASSLYQCRQDVLNSRSHVCIELTKKDPIELKSAGISKDINYETRAYVDFSKSRIVWGIIAKTQAVSEQHSKVLVQEVFMEFKDRIDEPMENLRDAYDDIDGVIGLVNQIGSNLDYIDSKYDDIVSESEALNSQIETLRSAVFAVNYAVTGVPDLDPSIFNKLNELDIALQNVQAHQGTLHSKIESGEISKTIDNAKNRINQVRNGLYSVKGRIDDVLDEWDELSQMDYASLAPLSFEYQSVTDGEGITGMVSGRKLEFLDYLFPSFLMFFIIFVSLVFSTLTTFKERSSRAHIRNITSRTGAWSFVSGNFFSIFLVLAVQILVILGVSIFFLRASIIANLLPLLVYSFVGITLFILGGIAIGYMFNSQDGAVIASVSISLLFLIFLPVITATETLPTAFAEIVGVMPFVILEGKIRMASIFNIFSAPSVGEFISLVFSFALSIALISYFYSRKKHLEV
ncbi:MAG: ABC transporter permease [archaeon]